ncbi:MBL fold metallo-hydrolase [Galactobacter valiniphilus]|uniref:MBL fold metallo-hydrolase n=1 Tax=Galactobacter valiniphilus TaxID=2676122 RepID=A0A399JCT7_9MICC|nr:MBL fold metallo-hydrolase [Galactobacter valiniphilus]RII43044.1 MBL fold metallo-hydrolase [Galactobacter valiniphilus]
MRLTKHGHSCITVHTEANGAPRTLAIDPGTLSDATAALAGADAVLVTHGHPDHVDDDVLFAFLLGNPGVPAYAPADVVARWNEREEAASLADRLHVVGADEEFEVLGVPVRSVGGQHALIHPLLRTIDNVGYILDGAVYHPGDALIVPAGDATLEVLLVPAWAPWSKTSEVVDFIAAVRARRAYGIHDAPLTAAGHKIVETQLAGLGGRTGSAYEPWASGESIDV